MCGYTERLLSGARRDLEEDVTHFPIVCAFDRCCVHGKANNCDSAPSVATDQSSVFPDEISVLSPSWSVSSKLTSHTLCYCVPWNVSLTMTVMIISSKVSEYSSFFPLLLSHSLFLTVHHYRNWYGSCKGLLGSCICNDACLSCVWWRGANDDSELSFRWSRDVSAHVTLRSISVWHFSGAWMWIVVTASVYTCAEGCRARFAYHDNSCAVIPVPFPVLRSVRTWMSRSCWRYPSESTANYWLTSWRRNWKWHTMIR